MTRRRSCETARFWSLADSASTQGAPSLPSSWYDPALNQWSRAGNLLTGLADHTATLLRNGKVLVAGGVHVEHDTPSDPPRAELYEPATNRWSSAGTLRTGRSGHTATLLRSGKVLVAGGTNQLGYVGAAELYDPATKSWSSAGDLIQARNFDTATLLRNGKVLVAGGFYNPAGFGPGPLASAELYDPATNRWSPTGNMGTARSGAMAALLRNGKVLVAGGYDNTTGPGPLVSAELYVQQRATIHRVSFGDGRTSRDAVAVAASTKPGPQTR